MPEAQAARGRPAMGGDGSRLLKSLQHLDIADNFPGWGRAPAYLQRLALDIGAHSIADIGGGARPLLTLPFIRAQGIHHCLIDISERELAKAPAHYRKVQADICTPPERFAQAIADAGRFDLVFSHNLLEHLRDPLAAHRNILQLLQPGGVAVHFYPSPNNLPLTLNRLLPEAASRALLRLAQPQRRLDADQCKFPAYYVMCGNSSPAIERGLDSLGYEVLQHTAYIGHEYYDAFPRLALAERRLRRLLLRWHIPMTSAVLLVLRRR